MTQQATLFGGDGRVRASEGLYEARSSVGRNQFGDPLPEGESTRSHRSVATREAHEWFESLGSRQRGRVILDAFARSRPKPVTAPGQSQNDRILGWLKTGRSITAAEAVEEFGCYRLAARIDELKKRPEVKIASVQEWAPTGKTYARYYLERAAS